MQINSPAHDRRRFLRLAAGFTTGALLSGCGGGGSASSEPIPVVASAVAKPAATAAVVSGQTPLNLALNLAYLGAQYHGFAARGAGLPSELTTGAGQAGSAYGARRATFGDTLIAGVAAELADDKQAHVIALRGQLGGAAAAQPPIDLSTASNGAFSTAAQGAGIVSAGAAFDPYAGDTSYLLGGFLVENAVAAAYRTLLAGTTDAATSALITAQLADAIYHGGLIRALLGDRAGSDASIGPALAGASAMLARLDGTNVGDQTLAGASGASSDILDADNRPIPFTRSGAQVLKVLYLSGSGAGGFMPAGANGAA